MADDSKYAYAVARVRVLENRLLNKGQIDRMAEAPGAREALQVLGETDYGSAVGELEDVHHFEDLLAAELGRVYGEVRRFYPEPRLIEALAAKYDVHNLKVLLKAEGMGKEAGEDLLYPEVGNIPLAKLQVMFATEDFRDLPCHLREAVEEVRAGWGENPDPQLIDIVLDGALYRHIFTLIAPIPFLEKFFTHQANLINIKTFIRVQILKQDEDFLHRVLLKGGDIPGHLFHELLPEPLEALCDRLALSPYAQVVEEGLQEWQEKGRLTRLEKLADDFLLEFVRSHRHQPFGPQPLLGYLLAVENELKLIRIIMVGKLNHLPIEEIRERLRDVYV